MLTLSGLANSFLFSRRKAVLDQWVGLLPWQLREKAEPAVNTISVWFDKWTEFRWIDGAAGGSKDAGTVIKHINKKLE